MIRVHIAVPVVIPVLMLGACESTPKIVEPVQSEREIAEGIDPMADHSESVMIGDAGGLGVIVYNDKTRAECKRRARPGSRVHRLTCDADETSGVTIADVTEGPARAPINQRRVAK